MGKILVKEAKLGLRDFNLIRWIVQEQVRKSKFLRKKKIFINEFPLKVELNLKTEILEPGEIANAHFLSNENELRTFFNMNQSDELILNDFDQPIDVDSDEEIAKWTFEANCETGTNLSSEANLGLKQTVLVSIYFTFIYDSNDFQVAQEGLDVFDLEEDPMKELKEGKILIAKKKIKKNSNGQDEILLKWLK